MAKCQGLVDELHRKNTVVDFLECGGFSKQLPRGVKEVNTGFILTTYPFMPIISFMHSLFRYQFPCCYSISICLI